MLFASSSTVLLLRMIAVALLIRMLVVALVFRDVGAATIDHEQFGWEMGWVARSIASGHGFSSPFLHLTGPTALVPPGYPYLLAGIFRIFGVYSLASSFVILSLDALFSALTCIPIYLIARDSINHRIARLAGWAWVIYPFSIYYSTVVWEWALTALLFTTCLWLLLRLPRVQGVSGWMGFGALYGVTALVNPAVLSVLPALFVVALWRVSRLGRPWFLKATMTTLTVVAVLAPWTMRTYRTMHILAPIRDNYWLEFYAGNSGDSFKSNVAWAHPASNPVEMRAFISKGEVVYLSDKHQLAAEFVKRHPVWFAVATARRFVRYWTGFWSFSPRYLYKEPLDIPNFFFCSTITFFMVLGARRLWRHSQNAALPLLMPIVIFPIAYYFSHASMDYRQPIEPVVVILVAVGIFGLKRRSQETDRLSVQHEWMSVLDNRSFVGK